MNPTVLFACALTLLAAVARPAHSEVGDRLEIQTHDPIVIATAQPRTGNPSDPAPTDRNGPDFVWPETLEQGFVIVVEDRSGMASDDQPIYLAGNNVNWNPADPSMRLSPRSDGRWQIHLTKPVEHGRLAFKFTLGSWETEELNTDGNVIDNRTLGFIDASTLAPGDPPVIELVVEQFREPKHVVADRRTALDPINATGDVRRIEVSGGAGPAGGIVRDLLVWLPPGYDDPANAERRYPVLYLFDGQNLFDTPPGLPAEWGVDETMTELITASKIPPMIVVGVPHAGAHRLSEYVMAGSAAGAEPAGPAFVRWFEDTIRPRAERALRLDPRPEATGVGGSSLGGLIALAIAAENPGEYGMLLIESPTRPTALGPEAKAYYDAIEPASLLAPPGRVWLGMGGREVSDAEADDDANTRRVAYARTLQSDLARMNGRSGERLSVYLAIDAEANHNEQAWAKRYPAAILFLTEHLRGSPPSGG